MFETEIENPTENLEVESSVTETPEQTSAAPIVDLDSVEKFRYAGREWTPKDFQGAYMMQSDYTKKTQALSEERKYYDNLQTDLDQVKANPQLAAEFRKVYPKNFHRYLDYVTPAQAAAEMKQTQSPGKLDQAVEDRINRIESAFHEQKVAAVEAELDAKFKTLAAKYDFADEEAVIARAQALLGRGEKLTDKVWDSLWKSVHDRNLKISDQRQAEKVKKQTQVNAQGKDMGSGGGTPGSAPKVARTIKEAANFAREALEHS